MTNFDGNVHDPNQMNHPSNMFNSGNPDGFFGHHDKSSNTHNEHAHLLHDFMPVDTIGVILFIIIVLVLTFFYVKHLKKK